MTTWSQAFSQQALSELEVYNVLNKNSVPISHRLHYLQMWLEKLCKSYIWLRGSTDVELQRKHNVVAKVLPTLISDKWQRMGFKSKPDQKSIHALCREIDLLHPQINDGGRQPENVEYPWLGRDATINVPAQWRFALAGELYTSNGKLLLKAAELLTRKPGIFMNSLPKH